MKKKSYNLSDMEGILHKTLTAGGTFRFYPRGTSMLPTIKEGRDMVLLTSIPEKLKKYQMILYKRDNGAYVLHRIVKIEGDDYTMRGDNQFVLEPGIRREQMIAIVCGIMREEKKINPESNIQRLKAALWVESVGPRKCLLTLRSYLSKVKKCLKQ